MNLDEYLSDKYVIPGTGSRSFAQEPRQKEILIQLQSWLVAKQVLNENLVVVSGGSRGWDAWVASMASKADIPFVLCLPNKGYGEYYWGRAGLMDTFSKMCAKAQWIEYTMEDVLKKPGLYVNGRHSNFLRNDRMVELGHEFVVYGPTSSGTKDCLASIKKANKPWKEFS